LLVQSETTTILVDTSPDMRAQLLVADAVHLDAVLWTHDHADHCHGLDDLRQIFHHRGSPVPGYARRETMAQLRARFGYAFSGRDGYPSVIESNDLPDRLTIGDIALCCVDMPHGSIFSTGFRFERGNKSLGYATDFHEVTNQMVAMFSGVDVWVIDALRVRPHPTHPHLGMTLEAIERARPSRSYLTHMDQSMDYETLCASLPPYIRPAYDGLTEEV
jgi:phosphoribosyl 1,2-cyclic phosphate phosphodiesterase